MVNEDAAPEFVTPLDKELPTKDDEKAWDDPTINNNETAACKNPLILCNTLAI